MSRGPWRHKSNAAEGALAIIAAREAREASEAPGSGPEVAWVHPPRCYACQPLLRHEHPTWDALPARGPARR